jgi:hypothetical protein
VGNDVDVTSNAVRGSEAGEDMGDSDEVVLDVIRTLIILNPGPVMDNTARGSKGEDVKNEVVFIFIASEMILPATDM